MQILRPSCGGLAFGLIAGPAQAHAPIAGIEGFYTGVLHPFTSPAQALLIISLGLLASSFAIPKARWLLGAFLVASLLGLWLGFTPPDLDPLCFAIAFAACACAALCPKRLPLLAALWTTLGGLCIGRLSIPDAGPVPDQIITASGAIIGANLGLLYIFGLTHAIQDRLAAPWVAIAFRIAAAWLGAISLLMLALGSVQTGA
ncbi:MAG: HupE/UreJ family protein [Mangrovicoccus sp.]|nr:HupE/UreJ family protein [Mangrovicoccus sp.]